MEKVWKIWIDTGGTFTDCLAVDPNQNLRRIKILSSGKLRGVITSNEGPLLKILVSWPETDDIFSGYRFKVDSKDEIFLVTGSDLKSGMIAIDKDPGILNGVTFEIFSEEEAPIVAARLATKTPLNQHLPKLEMRLGSTKGTNALLERKGDKVIFITTQGHKQMLEIGTQQRPDLFALNVVKQAPLYESVIEIDERVLSNGEISRELKLHESEKLSKSLTRFGGTIFAVALLNSYKNPVNELKIAGHLRGMGFSQISVSSKLVNEIGILTRAQTTVVNAYLSEIIENYLDSVKSKIREGGLKVMTSAGGLIDASLFLPKDSLLSGPAGGVVGSANTALEHGFAKILSFDMGGTSTDVSRYNGEYDYSFISEINHIRINSPSLAIETVAAGGGSICSFDGYKMAVGPESAGAAPGPACYGNSGPLAITDVNLLLGRIDHAKFSIPLNREASEKAFEEIKSRMGEGVTDEDVLDGFLKIANEKMAEAIRKISIGKGYDPAEYTLLAFGGAGGQHACSVADLLNIKSIIIPYDAGLLSAYGMGRAEIERFVTHQMLKPLNEVEHMLSELFSCMETEAISQLKKEEIPGETIYVRNRYAYLRFAGQENALEVEYGNKPLLESFKELYKRRYGHWLEKGLIELESLKLLVASKEFSLNYSDDEHESYSPKINEHINCFTGQEWAEVPAYGWEELTEGAVMKGPALVKSNNSTVFLEPGWEMEIVKRKDAILTRTAEKTKISEALTYSAELELFTNRFKSIADDMGAVLQRTSFSVNVKDRLDFSCAVLDKKGYLVANAPHIPVHLGSLGVCVRTVVELMEMQEGDVVITNHPGFGGSHLPDVTLIAPVFYEGKLTGYVVNRAHHAEIGGRTPGSMPADARFLGEEGVVIPPTYLVKGHHPHWENIENILGSGPYPSRSIKENLADLNGALASIQTGINGLILLCKTHGQSRVAEYMGKLLEYSGASLLMTFNKLQNSQWEAEEFLDDGSRINVKISKKEGEISFDFDGTSPTHPGNLNANLAILNSAIIYVLRLMLEEQLPLNEGLMKYVKISVPECMLNPVFGNDPMKSPAVVGGNTETSQRIVDTLIKALRLAACSQGTMSNLIFGNAKFGFYETIGGGVGAGNGFNGASAVHQHMTNTKITDPEILEFRYPVVLEKMGIREGSGGDGKWKGGDGIVRQIRFEEDVILTVLSQHRMQQPFGLDGGMPGKTGKQTVVRKSGERIELKGIETIELAKGDRIVIETPGGGGYGTL